MKKKNNRVRLLLMQIHISKYKKLDERPHCFNLNIKKKQPYFADKALSIPYGCAGYCNYYTARH